MYATNAPIIVDDIRGIVIPCIDRISSLPYAGPEHHRCPVCFGDVMRPGPGAVGLSVHWADGRISFVVCDRVCVALFRDRLCIDAAPRSFAHYLEMVEARAGLYFVRGEGGDVID